MKYIELGFRNAVFFEPNDRTKDFVYDICGLRRRAPSGQKVSISVDQISNMLHVFFSERPSATYRKTLIKPISRIRDIADKALIKITTMRYLNEKNGKYEYPKEIKQTNKSVGNSWRPEPGIIPWERIERFLTNDDDKSLYYELIDILEKILNKKVTNKSSIDIVNEVRTKFPYSEELELFKNKLKKLGKKPIADFLNEGVSNSAISMNSRTRLMNNIGIENVIRLDGSILIPLEDEDIEIIKNSNGSARLLDGGFVYIDDLIDSEYMSNNQLDGYININKLEEYENIS